MRRRARAKYTPEGKKIYPEQEYLNLLFRYDKGVLYRKSTGERAGTTLNTGYRAIYIDGVPYVEHVLIYIMFNGYRPEQVDHINQDKTDNRIENLRGCAIYQNLANRSKRTSSTTSKYKGVYWHSKNQKYTAIIICNKNRVNIGSFDSEVDAALAYNQRAIELFGEFAVLNEV